MFDEENGGSPQVAIDNVQNQITLPDIVRETTPDLDIANVPFPQDVVQGEQIIPDEQTPPPLEQLPLRRSNREWKSSLLDGYVVFLQEHEFDIGMVEDDPIY